MYFEIVIGTFAGVENTFLMLNLGHIISVVSWDHWDLRPPPPGDPTEADQTPACVQVASHPHVSPLFNQSHLEALSAAATLLLMALLLLDPVMPSVL